MTKQLKQLIDRFGPTLVLAMAEDERRGAAGQTAASQALDPQVRREVLALVSR